LRQANIKRNYQYRFEPYFLLISPPALARTELTTTWKHGGRMPTNPHPPASGSGPTHGRPPSVHRN